MIISSLISFAVSFLSGYIILRYADSHQSLTGDNDLTGVQKFHFFSVPRVGGVTVFFGYISAILVIFFSTDNSAYSLSFKLLLAATPVFLIGLAEDLFKHIRIKIRFLFMAISAGIAGFLFNAWLLNINISAFDLLLSLPFFSVLFTCFAVIGVVNSINLIDGFNGLASIVGFLILLAISYVAFCVSDYDILICCLTVNCAILGFVFWNFPRGKIFLGDGGAYLIGFFIAELSLLLVVRNPIVSKWLPLLACAYPIVETLFTIYRRVARRKNLGMPDAVHLHQLIFRRIIKHRYIDRTDLKWRTIQNSKTSPYLWLLTIIPIIPALLFWNVEWILQATFLLFCLVYLWIYFSIARFRTPGWLI
jgi:UDP-N-acetylmuramyl pentapeptide phosphotransferase/UDP-N-acetylglucosamine-1-phosphate transferase